MSKSIIGTDPDQCPTNADLGTMAFQDTESVRVGSIKSDNYKLSALNTAPASATATGSTGEIRVTATHIYVCTATNTWVRTALSTW